MEEGKKYNACDIFSITIDANSEMTAKLVNGKIVKLHGITQESILTNPYWKNHGMATFSETLLFIGSAEYAFENIVDIECHGDELGGFELTFVDGRKKSFYVTNRAEIYAAVLSRRLRVVQRYIFMGNIAIGGYVEQISGVDANEKKYASIPVVNISEMKYVKYGYCPATVIHLLSGGMVTLRGHPLHF